MDFTAPTVADLRRVYEEGLPVKLLSGVEVQMHPVQLEKLLEAGDVPDRLSELVLRALYEDVKDELDDFVMTPQTKKEQAMEVIRSIDAVCHAVLIDPSIVPYLPLSDRLWVFKLAFLPAEVLSRFRDEPPGDVDIVDESENVPQTAE